MADRRTVRSRSAVLATAVVAATSAAAFGLATPAQAAPVYVVPDAIAANCGADVTAPLNAWLAGLPRTAATIQFQTGGCYRVDRTVVLSGATGWVVEGRGATLSRSVATPPELRYPNANPHLQLTGVASTIVSGLRITGTNFVSDRDFLRPDYGAYDVTYEFEHGVRVDDSKAVTLTDLTINQVWGDGIYLRGNDGVTVNRVSIDKNGRQGIAITTGKNTVIENSAILHSRRSGIDLEPNISTDVVDGVKIRNNTLTSFLLGITGSGAGVVKNVLIQANTIPMSGVPVVSADATNSPAKWTGWTVADNNVGAIGSPSPYVRFRRTAGVVSANDFNLPADRSRLAIGLYNGSTATALCNWFRNGLKPLASTVDSTSRLTDGTGNSVDPKVRPKCGRLAVGG